MPPLEETFPLHAVNAAQRVKLFFSLVFASLFLEEAGGLQPSWRTLELCLADSDEELWGSPKGM